MTKPKPTKDLLAICDRVIEADDGRTPGEWKYKGRFSGYLQDHHILPVTSEQYKVASSLATISNDFHCIVTSVNHAARIAKALKVALGALQEIEKKVPELVGVPEAADMACEFKMGAQAALAECRERGSDE